MSTTTTTTTSTTTNPSTMQPLTIREDKDSDAFFGVDTLTPDSICPQVKKPKTLNSLKAQIMKMARGKKEEPIGLDYADFKEKIATNSFCTMFESIDSQRLLRSLTLVKCFSFHFLSIL
jgi:hypothetical protein